jgi:ribose 5-phosphate isomerase B
MNKPIAIACDHGGYQLKLQIMQHLTEQGYTYVDYGTNSEASVDYPVYAKKVCAAIQEGASDYGILICGTGIGMSMAANKQKGIRAACCTDTFSARFTRLHNDANVLCLGARVLGAGLALDLVDLYLTTPFEGGRHSNRIALLED